MLDNQFEPMKKYYLAIILLGFLIAAIIYQGFSIVGSPFLKKQIAQDKQRINDFTEISYAISNYYNKNYYLPKSLDQIEFDSYSKQKGTKITDPITGKKYHYETTSTIKYELCTTFATDSKEIDDMFNNNSKTPNYYYDYNYVYYDEKYQHKKGYDCIKLSVDSYNYPKISPYVYPTTKTGVFSNLSANLTDTKAEFKFEYSGSSTLFYADVTTDPDFINDKKLSFATGSNSPLTTTKISKYNGYQCDATIYWKILASSTNDWSPLQMTKVECNNAISKTKFTNLSAKLTKNEAKFYFDTNYQLDSYESYIIDVASDADFNNPDSHIYYNFATGYSSPTITTNPSKYDSYQCGAKIYWRIYINSETTSEIKNATVSCSQDLIPSPTDTFKPVMY